jgi:hypothetical protein
MAIIPRNFNRLRTALSQGIPPQVEGAEEYLMCHEDSVRNTGRGPLPEAMSGENVEHTPLLPAEAGRTEAEVTSDTTGESSYREPPIPSGGGNRSAVWQTRYGGSYIELSGRNTSDEYINILHASGARITIDQRGSIVIKSFGDTANLTEGNMSEVVNGSKTAVYKSGYTIHVQGGTCDIRSEGNMNISSGGDMSISAAGKLTMNIGDALDVAASKIALTSRVDTMDLLSTGILRMTGKADLHIKSDAGLFNESKGELNIKAGESITSSAGDSIFSKSGSLMNLQSGSKMSLKAGGVIAADGSQVQLNGGGADGAASAAAAATAIAAAAPDALEKSVFSQNTVLPSPGPIGSADIDDNTPNVGPR